MRQWLVPPSVLCTKHLLGEHVEHHMFVGSINKGIDCSTYINTGLLDPSKLVSRHEELVAEMTSRGMNHNSPLPEIKAAPLETYLKMPVCIGVEGNFEELSRRCVTCRARIMIHRQKQAA